MTRPKISHDLNGPNRLSPMPMMHKPGFLLVLLLCSMSACSRQTGSRQDAEGYLWPEEPLSFSEKRLEAELKIGRIREYLRREQIAGVLIGRSDNFAWITGGSESRGKAFLYLGDDGSNFLISDDDQLKRLNDAGLAEMGFRNRAVSWYLAADRCAQAASEAARLSGSRGFASDIQAAGARPAESALAGLRAPLTEFEIRKYRWLGKACANALSEAGRRVSPGMTERGIETLVSSALLRRAIQPVEVLIATDERAAVARELLPSDSRKLEKFLRIGIRARRWGLNVAFTRLIHFGPVPVQLQKQLAAGARVCAGMRARTVPGASARALLQGAIGDYAEAGRADEWKIADQGGAIGYCAPDWTAMPDSRQRLQDAQTFAWKAGIGGVVFEDTLLLFQENLEVLTESPDWPVIEADALGRTYRLPGILVRRNG